MSARSRIDECVLRARYRLERAQHDLHSTERHVARVMANSRTHTPPLWLTPHLHETQGHVRAARDTLAVLLWARRALGQRQRRVAQPRTPVQGV